MHYEGERQRGCVEWGEHEGVVWIDPQEYRDFLYNGDNCTEHEGYVCGGCFLQKWVGGFSNVNVTWFEEGNDPEEAVNE